MNFLKMLTALSVFDCVAATLCVSKPAIEPRDAGNWYRIADADLCGNYVSYSILNRPKDSSTLVTRAIHGEWKVEAVGARWLGFSTDGRLAIAQEPNRTLALYTLGTDLVERIPDVVSAKVSGGRGQSDWVAYQLGDTDKTLIVRNLISGDCRQFVGVAQYTFSNPLGRMLSLHRTKALSDSNRITLECMDLKKGESSTVVVIDAPMAAKVSEPHEIIDENQNALVWATEQTTTTGSATTIWYFKAGMSTPEVLVNDQSTGIPAGKRIAPSGQVHLEFGGDGQLVRFNLIAAKPDLQKVDVASLDVWSYKDARVQSDQLAELKSGPELFLSAVLLANHRVIPLKGPLDLMTPGQPWEGYALVARGPLGNLGSGPEVTWNRAAQIRIELISLVDGSCKILAENVKPGAWFSYRLSPGQRYVVYFDTKTQNWYSYTIASGRVRCLTENLKVQWTREDEHDPGASCREGVVGWMENDSTVLICSRDDIWRIDPEAKASPVNLTRSHTSRREVEFSLARSAFVSPNDGPLDPMAPLLLTAFDKQTKDEGMIWIKPGELPDNDPVIFVPATLKLYTRKKSGVLLKKGDAAHAPNLFYSENLKSFLQLSDVHPEKAYRWLTAELLSWQTLDGRQTQGVLYKPEDFDPAKKYPVILEFYEQMSSELNSFGEPHLGSDMLTPPFLTGRGYLLLRVDIHYEPGSSGHSAYSAVVSAAKLLAIKPWVDAKHMAIRGQSFGAYETNYIAAHTDMFAAAVATSGWADFVSASNNVIYPGGGTVRQPMYEYGRESMGGTLWTKRAEYIENSPIFDADKVTTPMLLMNNEHDDNVNWWQGVEWFMALRRLGKKAWMLQYDHGKHGLSRDDDIADFDQRMMQFLNHYLKGTPPPKWMTEGIPARLKGYEDGLGLDTSGRVP